MSELTGYIEAAKIQPVLEDIVITPSKQEQNFKSVVDGYDKIRVNAVPFETLNIKPAQKQQVFDGVYDQVKVSAIVGDVLEVTPKQENQSFTGLYEQVYVDAIVGETLDVTPTKEPQTFNGLYETVNVAEMHGDTLNITPTETTQAFNGIYENINVGAINTEEVTIDPDFSVWAKTEVTATTGKYIKKATINKDTDLLPENIKSGVNIYGVDGNIEILDTSDATATAEDIAKGKTAYVDGKKVEGNLAVASEDYQIKITTKGLTTFQSFFASIGTNFTEGSSIEGEIDFDGITKANYMFNGCTYLTDISNLKFKNTHNLQWINNMFDSSYLKSTPDLDCSSVTIVKNAFSCNRLERMGKVYNLGKAYTQTTEGYANYTLTIPNSAKLTNENLIEVFDSLYDLNLSYNVAGGGTLYKQNISLLAQYVTNLQATEEGQQAIERVQAKGWNLVY